MSIRNRLLALVLGIWVAGYITPLILYRDLSVAHTQHDHVFNLSRQMAAAQIISSEISNYQQLQSQYNDYQTLIVPQQSHRFIDALTTLRAAYPAQTSRIEADLDRALQTASDANKLGFEAQVKARGQVLNDLKQAGVKSSQLHDQLARGFPDTPAMGIANQRWAQSTVWQTAIAFLFFAGLLHYVLRPWTGLSEALRKLAAGLPVPELDLQPRHGLGHIHKVLKQLRNLNRRLDETAHTDPLTLTANRHRCEQWIEEFAAEGQKGHVLLVDVDGLNQINIGLGSHIGDMCIREVSERIGKLIGPQELMGRYSGDKFLIISPNSRQDTLKEDHAQELPQLAQMIISSMQEPYMRCGHRISLSVSIGIAVAPRHGRDAFQLIGAANSALTDAKRFGRSNAQIARSAFRGKPLEMFRHLSEIDRALEKGEFQAHLQPVIDTHTGAVVCVEALARWHHPERGVLSPHHFMTAMETGGKIAQLSTQLFIGVCEHLADFRLRRIDVPLAFNLSASELQADHIHKLMDTFASTGLPRGSIEFEITETSLIENVARVMPLIHELRAAGFRIALDDFGTGYSSLTHLQTMPINKIKIDRSFVERLATEKQSREITSALSQLAKGLDLTIVAEGVESEAQSNMLISRGVPLQQGYLFARPMPHDEFLSWYYKRSTPQVMSRRLCAA